MPIEREARGLEHARPVDRVWLEDVLADEVLHHRPERFVARVAGTAYRRDVVDQRVEPDVRDELVVERQGNPPLQSLARSADRQILQGIPQEAEDLVAIALGADQVRSELDLVDQPRL